MGIPNVNFEYGYPLSIKSLFCTQIWAPTKMVTKMTVSCSFVLLIVIIAPFHCWALCRSPMSESDSSGFGILSLLRMPFSVTIATVIKVSYQTLAFWHLFL